MEVNMQPIGRTHWAIAEGYIPPQSMAGADGALLSHEAACILNTGDSTAHVEITLFFVDREPDGPYNVEVPARRKLHFRLNELHDPDPVPVGVDSDQRRESGVPIWRP